MKWKLPFTPIMIEIFILTLAMYTGIEALQLQSSPTFKMIEKSVLIDLKKPEISKKYSNQCHEIYDNRGVRDRRFALSALSTMFSALPVILRPQRANAEDSTANENARRFRKVPTFAIVDGSTGIPFMILKNGGTATGYFFTNYESATVVLDNAKSDAAEKDRSTLSTWENARITSVPLEFALKLSEARLDAKAQNGQSYSTLYDILPTAGDLSDGKRINKGAIFDEQGRVPLFYIEELEGETESGEKRLPVYFAKSDLIKTWKKNFPDKQPPPVQVIELIDTFTAMVNPRAGISGDQKLLKKIVLIPSLDSKQSATECEKGRGSSPAYKAGEMIAVGGT